MLGRRRLESPSFAGFRYPPEVILLAVRWCLRHGLSYRDIEELLAERGVGSEHVAGAGDAREGSAPSRREDVTYRRVCRAFRRVAYRRFGAIDQANPSKDEVRCDRSARAAIESPLWPRW